MFSLFAPRFVCLNFLLTVTMLPVFYSQIQSLCIGIMGAPTTSGCFPLQLMVSSSPLSKESDKQWRPKSVDILTTLSCNGLLCPTNNFGNGGNDHLCNQWQYLGRPSKTSLKSWRMQECKTALKSQFVALVVIAKSQPWSKSSASEFGATFWTAFIQSDGMFLSIYLVQFILHGLCKYLNYLVGIDCGSVSGTILKWAPSRKRQIEKDASACNSLDINI